jgi:hypothetical protein
MTTWELRDPVTATRFRYYPIFWGLGTNRKIVESKEGKREKA